VLIKTYKIINPYNYSATQEKSSAFADDVASLVRNDIVSIRELFKEYEKFSKSSGIHLNADKTEILNVLGREESHEITYDKQCVKIDTKKEVKVCGKTFSTCQKIEMERNNEKKIAKLEKQLTIWSQRDLTLEGKINIVKTFGLSQVIYFLQNTYYNHKQLTKIESIIYKFIWTKGRWNNKQPERIKRSIMKNSYENGGLKAPDIQAIDLSLKTAYLIRIINTENHYKKDLVDYHIHKAGNYERESQCYQTGSSGDFFIDEGLRGINLSFKLLNNDLNTLLLNGLLKNKMYANVIASNTVANYAKNNFDIKNMTQRGFDTFNKIFNCITFPTSDHHYLRNRALKSYFPA